MFERQAFYAQDVCFSQFFLSLTIDKFIRKFLSLNLYEVSCSMTTAWSLNVVLEVVGVPDVGDNRELDVIN